MKENYTGNWIFPVGISDGDYTPAAINNSAANTMHVSVQDYATSISDEGFVSAASDGIDRTWNIYADIATGNSNINLQHNSITNQPLFNDAFNFVTRWGTIVPNPTGDYTIAFGMSAWQSNLGASSALGNLSSTGTVPGSSMRSRNYLDFATSPTAATAYFSKSSDVFHPLPVGITSFTAQVKDCSVILNFESCVESHLNKYQIQRSSDGRTFNTIVTFNPNGSNEKYTFVDEQVPNGMNFYRLMIIENSGDYTMSQTIQKLVDCSQMNIVLYPNPATVFIALNGISGSSEIRIINLNGRIVLAISSIKNFEMIDISQLPSGMYVLQLFNDIGHINTIKFQKQ